jgi:arginine utilization protein RocB
VSIDFLQGIGVTLFRAMFAGTTGLCLAAFFCTAASAQSIYTCVDAKGRKITADRPIAECTDRTQRELSKTGTVRREIGPSLTAQELAAQEAKEKVAEEARARDVENKRRDRALLSRYPSRAVHDQERTTALAQVDEVIKAANKRTGELAEQRKAIDSELEFYIKDPSKAPLALKRRIEENDKSVAVQKRFIAEQDLEKKRVNLRFDEELVKLKGLWTLTGGAATGAAAGEAPTAKAAVKP